jgi:class 3 adenylate cyclase
VESELATTLDEGRRAFADHRWQDAFELLCRADGGERLAADDLARLAEAARWSGNYDAMFNAFERAEAMYARAGERRRAARMALELTLEHFYRANDSAQMAWYSRAASLLGDDTDCAEYGLVLWAEARFLLDLGQIEEAAKMLARQLELARRIDATEVEALAILDLGHTNIIEGRIAEGLRQIDAANALVLGGGTALWATGLVYCSTIWACRNIGDWRRAREWTDTSTRWCERESVSHFPGLCRFHRAEVLRIRGHLDDAERDANAAIDQLLEANPRDAPWAYNELGEIRRRRGDLAGAALAFRKAIEGAFDPQPGLSLLRLDEGKPKVALRAITEALDDESWFGREGRSFLLPAQVTIAIAAGELDVAAGALAELETRATASGSDAFRASADCAAGELALARGDLEDAHRLLRRGVRGWHRVDAPFEAAQARVLLARTHRLLGDDDEAALELAAARDAFAAIGAALEAERADQLLETPMLTGRAVRTFVFTDIVDSTRLVELLGDDAWENLLAWHDRTLRTCFDAHAGEEVKHEGDGFFVAFLDPTAAIACATHVQRTLTDHRREHGFAPQVRIGVHTAEATARPGDYTGQGVHVAARIAASGGAGEIVVSRVALDATAGGYALGAARRLELKGVAEPVEVVTVDWS